MNSAVEAPASQDDDWDDDEYLIQRMEWVHAANKRQVFKDYSNARDADEEALYERLEQENLYLATLYEEEGPCQHTEYQQYLRLIVFWLRCVKADKAYGDYCDAMKLGRDPSIPSGSFMPEFYKDWRDVRGIKNEVDWIKANYYLFMPALIEAVEPGSVVTKGVMAVNVPQGAAKAEHLNLMFAALMDQAKFLGPKPKYQIKKIRGETFADTALRMHISSYIHGQFDFEDDSVRGVTRKYLSEWELFQGMQGIVYEPVPDDKLEAEVEKNRKTIRRWKETYELCVTKSIARTFPPKHTNTKE